MEGCAGKFFVKHSAATNSRPAIARPSKRRARTSPPQATVTATSQADPTKSASATVTVVIGVQVEHKFHRLTNQIIVAGGGFSAGGDSGSLIVMQDTADPVALLFGGSDVDVAANPIGDVLNYFQSGSNAMTFVGGSAHAVIGCTLPTASAIAAVPLSAASSQALRRAIAARTAHESELMVLPEVQALGVGASQDSLGEAAIVFFVKTHAARTGIPQEVEGIRTRILEGEIFAQRGLLTAEQTAALEQGLVVTPSAYAISEAEFARAKAVHSARMEEWMSKAGVQGVGIGASVDEPGEAALMIFLTRGVAHETIPATIDGVRTRVRESSAFVAGLGEEHASGGCSARTDQRAKRP